MSNFERKKLETDLRNFTERNFESPGNCKNLDQIRFYVRELCMKIEEYERRFNFVPGSAYSLLAQYNMVQNRLIQVEFRKAYRG
jgi:hypothetical protein